MNDFCKAAYSERKEMSDSERGSEGRGGSTLSGYDLKSVDVDVYKREIRIPHSGQARAHLRAALVSS